MQNAQGLFEYNLKVKKDVLFRVIYDQQGNVAFNTLDVEPCDRHGDFLLYKCILPAGCYVMKEYGDICIKITFEIREENENSELKFYDGKITEMETIQ